MKKITLRKSSLSLVPTEERSFKIDYEKELNDAQYAAATTLDGPLCVIAGAGTGKTRTLTYRVARLIECGVAPESILLLTFTRKAAQEMLNRAAMLLDARTERVSGGTFHSFANMILRRHGDRLGIMPSFTILDQPDAEDVVNLLRTRGGFESKKKRFPRKQACYDIFSTSVNTVRPIESVIADEYPQHLDLAEHIIELSKLYVGYKRQHDLLDYDDLLIYLVHLLEQHLGVRDQLTRMYRYVMVDEYQDTNALQARIVQLLGGDRANVMVVGDDSQSIYSFRGANFRNIMDFPTQFPGTVVITLEENFRSTQPILNLTNDIIERAKEKYEKHLFTPREGGELPIIVEAMSENLQSRFVVQRILELHEEGLALRDMAVLFRAAYLSFDLEIELNKANIPYVKFGGLKFIETAHVKDMIAYLRVVQNPKDVISWNRILLLIDGVGPRTAERVTDEIASGRITLSPTSKARLTQVTNIAGIAELFDLLASIASTEAMPADAAQLILHYYEPILRTRYDDYTKRLKDLEMFLAIAERYRSVGAMLTDLALEPPTESVTELLAGGVEDDFLTLSTVHSAKGLEWQAVFVIHVLDGRIPSLNAASSDEQMEEERRLLYVACTRAKNRLVLSYPINMFDRASGMMLSKPSRFIAGVPEHLLERFAIEDDDEYDTPALLAD